MSLQGIPDRIQCVWSDHIGSEALRKISLQGLEKSQMDKVPELRIVICLEKKGNGFLTCLAREPLLAERLSWVFASISIGAAVCTINCLRPQLYLNNVKVSYEVHFPRTPFQDSGARRDFQHHSLWGLPSHFLFALGFPLNSFVQSQWGHTITLPPLWTISRLQVTHGSSRVGVWDDSKTSVIY